MDIETKAQSLLDEHRLPGFGLAISQRDRVVYTGGFGLWSIDPAVRSDEHSMYSLASVTKGFTGAAISLLAIEGCLSIDDPVLKHVPGLPTHWSSVTLRHLLNHTSGITCYLNELPSEDCSVDKTADELIDRVRGLPLKFEPGSAFAYGNTGNVLLGMVVSHVSGIDWPEFYQERLFAPNSMPSTRVILTMAATLEAGVAGYDWETDHFEPCLSWSPSWANAAGAIVTTPTDMANWGRALLGGGALPSSATDLIWSSATLADGSPLKVGFGWNVDEDDDGRRRHTGYGGGPGISSHICAYPDEGVVASAYSNTGDVFGPLAELAQSAAKDAMV